MSTKRQPPNPPQEAVELGEILEAHLQELREKGITPTATETAWLLRACEAIRRPSGAEDVLARGRPMRAGSLWLWPMTRQAQTWWSRAVEWFDDEDAALALGYSMAHGREAGAFDRLYSYAAARDAIRAFGDGLDCTAGELSIAIEGCLRQMSDGLDALEPEAGDGSHDGPNIVCRLQERLGESADHWERLVSLRYITDMLQTLAAQSDAEGGRVSEPHMRATANMAAVLWAIEEAHRGE